MTFALLNKVNMTEILILYAVRNSDGQYFRAKGFGGGGASWVDELKDAKVYAKLGQTRSRITYFANHYPKYPNPVLIKLTVTGLEVVDEKDRVEKAKQKKKTAEAEYKKRQAQWDLEEAENDLAEAQKNLNKLKGKKK